ncbi:MAG: YbeD family protein [Halothiobacillaceae bacterium]
MNRPLPSCPLEGSDRDTLLEFPCRFPVKVMGQATPRFEEDIRAVFEKHVPGLEEDAYVVRGSRAGRFVAITVTIQAQSQGQLDALYLDLTAHPDVKMCL